MDPHKNLGVTFDSTMYMKFHISKLKSLDFKIYSMGKIWKSTNNKVAAKSSETSKKGHSNSLL